MLEMSRAPFGDAVQEFVRSSRPDLGGGRQSSGIGRGGARGGRRADRRSRRLLGGAAKSLPSFFPGHQAGSAHHHVKHGIAAFLLGLAVLAFAWFRSGPKRSPAPPRGAVH
jgi:hypothetical protein